MHARQQRANCCRRRCHRVRFAEVRLHSQLRHPHILRLHAVFEDESYVFLVTEFAEVERGAPAGPALPPPAPLLARQAVGSLAAVTLLGGTQANNPAQHFCPPLTTRAAP